ncbi:helix-turn-helix domain-containing protein [Shewanella fidelis]|uniref:helix-turn-helix domain-containing protein n=1 Tax=Shewanella fidelis TaxID=173509 RepID=UPI00048B18B6|nr:helix-turn-helix domain-containing protein [Shewanella fidelis]
MINYKIRPAILTKSIIEFFKNKKIAIPTEFDFIINLDDSDSVSIRCFTRILDALESEINDNHFYYELVKHFESRTLNYFSPMLKGKKTPIDRLICFYKIYQGHMASVDWELYDDNRTLTLVAKRGNQIASSKFDDLILYSFINTLIHSESYNEVNEITVELPFERAFYKPYLDFVKNASFSTGNLVITILKNQHQTNKGVNLYIPKSTTSISKQIIAAANMIPINELDLTSLAFNLSVSKRSLQRWLKELELCPHEFIDTVKFNHVKRILISNKGNIKKTAYDCGFKDQGKLTKIFIKNSGLPPKEWLRQPQ